MNNKNPGLTLIELILTMVVAAIVLVPASIAVVESVCHSHWPEHYTIASALLQREAERIAHLRFSAVVNEGPLSYGGNFSNYSYQVNCCYVDSGGLNTAVPGPTDYKRVTLTILRSGFPDISAVTVVTNN